jgi:choline dehydrogenase-like flavoprotein
MAEIAVVGSGACGVHFALTALQQGHRVVLLDVGYRPPPVVRPDATFDGLKEGLEDPVGYFLGPAGEGIVYPASKPSYYGHPPSKSYVFRIPDRFATRARAMAPLFSFARGGLAEAWTAGSYAFGDDDLADFPFGYEALRPCYQEVARRIGVGAVRDDLARFIPFDADYLDPLPLDEHSALLLERYAAQRSRLNERYGFYLGRSRVATLSRDYAGRRGCAQLGRCLWGCPVGAIYSPAHTLEECLRFPGFRYLSGALVRYFTYGTDGRVTSLAAEALEGGGPVEVRADWYVLAAGALATSKIVLDSVWRRTGRIAALPGLMDNRQAHVPFLSFGMLGRPVQTASYQYHHLAFGLPQPDPRDYIHGQITTLKAAAVHPIVQSLPLDLRSALDAFRGIRAGLGIANVNLCDRRREASRLTIEPVPGTDRTTLVLEYADDPAEPARLAQALRQVRRALRSLGCLVPPGMTRILPKGASVHYAGTLPMSREAGEYTCDPLGRAHGFPNLIVADGAGFPFLPAKNLTFTLMANAVRLASQIP